MDVYTAAHYALGGRPTSECVNNPDFFFPVYNAATDWYDNSVEIVLDARTPPINQEQANIILALGFSMIFESQGDRCTIWTERGSHPHSGPHVGSEEDFKLYKAHLHIKALQEKIERMTAHE